MLECFSGTPPPRCLSLPLTHLCALAAGSTNTNKISGAQWVAQNANSDVLQRGTDSLYTNLVAARAGYGERLYNSKDRRRGAVTNAETMFRKYQDGSMSEIIKTYTLY